MALSRWISLTALPVALFAGNAAAETPVHHNRDDAELAQLRVEHPESAELLVRAEKLMRDGKLSDAEPLLAKAAAGAPLSFLASRRHCQALVELGRRSGAVDACNAALGGGHMAMDRLAMVSALMTGPGAPTSRDVSTAITLAITAKNLTGQPFGDAALCEVAYRVGDADMLKDCTSELNRIAPSHYLTRRWNLVRGERSGLGYWLVWLGFAAAGLSTLVHALRSRKSPRRALTASVVAAAVGALVVAQPAPARAEQGSDAPAPSASAVPSAEEGPEGHVTKPGHWQLSHFAINYDNPEGLIPTEAERNKSPLHFGYFLQDLASEGAYAEKKGDYATAVKFWRALAKTVPDNAMGFRRACQAYEALKDRVNGLDFCGQTLTVQGAQLDDYLRYSDMMLMRTGPLDKAERSDFDNTIKHLREQGGENTLLVAETMTCELGVHEESVKLLEGCTQSLEKLKPNEPATMSFQWSLAMFKHDYAAADELVTRLRAVNYKPELVARMAASVDSERRWFKQLASNWRYQLPIIGLVVAGLAALLFARKKPNVGSPPSPAPGVS